MEHKIITRQFIAGGLAIIFGFGGGCDLAFRDYSEFRMSEQNKTHSSFKCGYCHTNYEVRDKKYLLSERKEEIRVVKKAETTSSKGLFSERMDRDYIRDQVNDSLDRAGLLNPIQKKINKTIKIINEKEINKKARLIYENLNDLEDGMIIFNGSKYSINERRYKK